MTLITDNFFDDQSENTAAKINFYQKYIGNYIIKALMQFGEVFIFDMLCGPGKNGSNDGSPLILLKEATKMLSSGILKQRHSTPKINVLFNDVDINNINSLKNELQNLDYPRNEINIELSNDTFESSYEKIKNSNVYKKNLPKFFFLDPYTYSLIGINYVIDIISKNYSECLIFIPTSFVYRFRNAENKPKKVIEFLDTFTNGNAFSGDIDNFHESIRSRMLGISEFVRVVKLNGGTSKFALFLLTNSIHGMKLMNELVWKNSEDGKGKAYVRKENKQFEHNLRLFGDELKPSNVKDRFDVLNSQIRLELSNNPTNIELIRQAIAAEFLPQHAKKYLQELQNSKELEVQYLTDKQNGYYLGFDNYNKEPKCRFKLKE